MIQFALVESYYSLKLEINEVLELDRKRKALITTALLTLSKRKKNEENNKKHKTENKQTHEYELIISKLKQESVTKEKVWELKVESFKEEVKRLKLQLKEQKIQPSVPSLDTFQPRLDSAGSLHTFSTSPYVSKISFASGEVKDAGLIFLSRAKSLFDEATNILTPVKKKQIYPFSKKKKREYTNFNTMRRQHEVSLSSQKKSLSETLSRQSTTPERNNVNHLNHPITHQSTPTGKPTPISNGMLFEDQEKSLEDVISGSFTRTQGNQEDISSSTIESHQTTHSDLESSFLNVESASTEGKPNKRKVLNLWKSQVSKVSNSFSQIPTDDAKALHLEDEELNTLNYYQDANFLEENDDNSPARKRHRPDPDSSMASSVLANKKRNIFKID